MYLTLIINYSNLKKKKKCTSKGIVVISYTKNALRLEHSIPFH